MRDAFFFIDEVIDDAENGVIGNENHPIFSEYSEEGDIEQQNALRFGKMFPLDVQRTGNMVYILLCLFPLSHLGVACFVSDSGEGAAIENPLFCSFSEFLRNIPIDPECMSTSITFSPSATIFFLSSRFHNVYNIVIKPKLW